jgi:crossover junction endodeoxyribonuclease RusA
MIEPAHHSFRIDLPPQVKQRPRMTRRGRVYTPAKTLNYELGVAQFYDGPLFDGPVAIHLMFGKNHTDVTVVQTIKPTVYLRGDLDNYVKSVADGLNGVAYSDDRQIVRIHATRL